MTFTQRNTECLGVTRAAAVAVVEGAATEAAPGDPRPVAAAEAAVREAARRRISRTCCAADRTG